jgi:hypothetical protein
MKRNRLYAVGAAVLLLAALVLGGGFLEEQHREFVVQEALVTVYDAGAGTEKEWEQRALSRLTPEGIASLGDGFAAELLHRADRFGLVGAEVGHSRPHFYAWRRGSGGTWIVQYSVPITLKAYPGSDIGISPQGEIELKLVDGRWKAVRIIGASPYFVP